MERLKAFTAALILMVTLVPYLVLEVSAAVELGVAYSRTADAYLQGTDPEQVWFSGALAAFTLVWMVPLCCAALYGAVRGPFSRAERRGFALKALSAFSPDPTPRKGG